MPLGIALTLLVLAFSLCLSVMGAETVAPQGAKRVAVQRGAEGLNLLFLDFRDASCTDRCHVNSLSYRNDFKGEVFQHATHPPTQGWGLHCVDCHEDKEVNREGHGRLTIGKEDCLSCHHVDKRNMSCARCHKNMDAKPMEYNKKPFVHGFTADSDVNCKECHLADSQSSMREGINCQKCHHTRPRMACLGCHEESLTKVYYPRPVAMNHLGWTTGFLHSQHPEARLSCQECHPPREDRAKGVGEYQAHCGQCHHKEKADCHECHQAVYHFFSGKPLINGVKSIPDQMSRVLKCEDCHKPLKGGGGFSEVGEECARCHNRHYAELLEAQRDAVASWLDRLKKTLSPLSLLHPWQEEGASTHERIYGDETVFNPSVNSGAEPAEAPSGLLPEAGLGQSLELFELVEHYGLHNFSYSRRILSFLERSQ